MMANPTKQSVTINNEEYSLDENKVPMWYVFTTTIDLDENIEAITIVIGPSTEGTKAVVDYMNNEVKGYNNPVEYRGGFDHEPSEEELAQFAPEGYEEAEEL